MLNCREVTKLCSRALEQPLGLRERIALRAHLLMCSGCTNFRRQISALREAARAYAEGRAVSGDRDPQDER